MSVHQYGINDYTVTTSETLELPRGDEVTDTSINTLPQTMDSDILDIVQLINKVDMKQVLKERCNIILSSELSVDVMITLVKIILNNSIIITNNVKELEKVVASMQVKFNELEEKYHTLSKENDNNKSALVTLQDHKNILEEKYKKLKKSAEEVWVPFPDCREDLVELNVKYIPTLTLNDKEHIAFGYNNKRQYLKEKYHIDDMSNGTVVPLVELLYKCPERHGSFGNVRLNLLINSKVGNLKSHGANINRRSDANVMPKGFTLNTDERWIGDEDISIYVKEEHRTFDKRTYLESSIFDIENNTSHDIKLNLRKQYPDDPNVVAYVDKEHKCKNAFFDGFSVDRPSLSDGAYLLELVTLTPLEMSRFKARLPERIAKRKIYGNMENLKVLLKDDETSTELRYDVLVVTKIHTDEMDVGMSYCLRSWRLASIELYNRSINNITIPQLHRSIELFNPPDEPGFILYEHSPDNEVIEHKSIERCDITEPTVIIQDTVWRNTGTGKNCIPHERQPVFIKNGNNDWFRSLAKYGLSLDPSLPKGHDALEEMRSKIRELQDINAAINNDLDSSRISIKRLKREAKNHKSVEKVKESDIARKHKLEIMDLKAALKSGEVKRDASLKVGEMKRDTDVKLDRIEVKARQHVKSKEDKNILIKRVIGGVIVFVSLVGLVVLSKGKLLQPAVFGTAILTIIKVGSTMLMG